MLIRDADRWKKTPEGPVEIDWSHPLARGLQVFVIPGRSTRVFDPVSKTFLLLDGSPTTGTNAAGAALVCPDGANNGLRTAALPKWDLTGPNPFTFDIQCSLPAATSETTHTLLRIDNGTPEKIFLNYYDSGTFGIGWQASDSVNFSSYVNAWHSATVVPGQVFHAVGLYTGTALGIYFNGVTSGLTATDKTPLSQSGSYFSTGNLQQVRPPDNGGKLLNYARCWFRALSVEEIRLARAEPFALLRPRKTALYYLPPPPITEGEGGTQTGTPPTLTGTTRFYLPYSTSSDAALSPAYTAGWDNTTSTVRNRMSTSTGTTPITNVVLTKSVTTNNYDMLFRQYVSDPIGWNTTIAGTVKGAIRGQVSANTNNAFINQVVKLVDSTGGNERILYALGTSASTTNAWEFTTAAGVRSIPAGAFGTTFTLTEQTALAGDRLVVEIGTRLNTANSGVTSTLAFGDNQASDIPESTTTSTLNPWVEFSTALPVNHAYRQVYIITPASVSASGGQSEFHSGSAAIVAVGSVSPVATTVRSVSASVPASATLVPTVSSTHFGIAGTVVLNPVLAVTATNVRNVAVGLTSTPVVSGIVATIRFGGTSVTGTPIPAVVSSTTVRTVSASFGANPVASVQGNTARFGTSSQSLVPVLTTVGTPNRISSTLNVAGSSSLAVQATSVRTSAGALSLSGVLTGNGGTVRIANAAIVSGATLAASGALSEGAAGSADLISPLSVFSVSVTSARSVSIGLTANPVLATQAQSVRSSSGTIPVSSDVVPVSTTARFGNAAIAAPTSSFSVTGTASVEESYDGDASLGITPVLVVTGVTARAAAATLAASPALAVSTAQIRTSGAVSVAASAALATQVIPVRSGVGAINSAPTLTTNATSVRNGSAALSLTTGPGGYSGGFSGGFDRSQTSITLTASGLVFEGSAGSAGITSTPSLTVTAVTTRISTGTLAAPVTLSAQTASIRFGSGTVGLSPSVNAGSAITVRAATGTVTATSVLTGAGTTARATLASISSSLAISVSVTSLRFGGASLASDLVASGAGTVQELVSRSATLEITPVLAAAVSTVRAVSVTLNIAAELTGSATTTRPTDITVPSAVVVSAIGIRGIGGAAAINAEPTFSVVATSTYIASATTAVSPVLTGSSTTLRSGSATLVGTPALVVVGAPQEHISRSASLSATPTINLGVQPGHAGTASLASSPTISVGAVTTNRPVAVIVSNVTATSATYSLIQEDAYTRAANINAPATVTVGAITADYSSAIVTGAMGPAALTVVVSRTSESSANLPGASVLTVVATTHRVASELTEVHAPPVVSGVARTVRISSIALVGIPVLIASGDAAENLRVAHISLQGAVNDVVPLSGLHRGSVDLFGVVSGRS